MLPMIRFKIKIAEHVFGVCAGFESTADYCREYHTDEVPDHELVLTPEDIAYERECARKVEYPMEPPDWVFSDPYLESSALMRKITDALFDAGVLMFHGSVIAVDGEAYLFTAPSGTGKSTHTRLWREMLGSRAVMVNDDKPFLSIGKDGVVAHGSPWNGKHGLASPIAVPLKAICILERGGENEIRRIMPKDALLSLFQQSYRPRDPDRMPWYLDMLDGLASGVRFYRLRCNMEPEAAKLAFRMLSEDN